MGTPPQCGEPSEVGVGSGGVTGSVNATWRVPSCCFRMLLALAFFSSFPVALGSVVTLGLDF